VFASLLDIAESLAGGVITARVTFDLGALLDLITLLEEIATLLAQNRGDDAEAIARGASSFSGAITQGGTVPSSVINAVRDLLDALRALSPAAFAAQRDALVEAIIIAVVVATGGQMVQATLSGAQEVPPVTTGASGTSALTISADQTQISFSLTTQNITGVTQAHIHVGPAGVNGPVILFLCTNLTPPSGVPTPPTCPTSGGTVTGILTAANLIPNIGAGINTFANAVNAILNGNAYVNVHTSQNPGGEIRGQIGP